jgi:hypothetical protein
MAKAAKKTRGKNTPDKNAPEDGTEMAYVLRSGKAIKAVYDGGRMCCGECERVFQVAKKKPLTGDQKKRLREREDKAMSGGADAIRTAIKRMQQKDARLGNDVRTNAECLEEIMSSNGLDKLG